MARAVGALLLALAIAAPIAAEELPTRPGPCDRQCLLQAMERFLAAMVAAKPDCPATSRPG